MDSQGQTTWVGDTLVRDVVVAAGGGDWGPGLIFDASAADPQSWEELSSWLEEAFTACQAAAGAGEPIVFLLDEASLYGLRSPLRSTLGCGLLGGARSLAAEFARKGGTCSIVSVSGSSLPRVIELLPTLLSSAPNGSTVLTGDEHIGRPAP